MRGSYRILILPPQFESKSGQNNPENRRTLSFATASLVEEGLENTLNRQPPKASKRRIIHGEEEAHLVAMACSEPPEGHCRWTVRLLADKMVELEYLPSVSHMTIHNALKKRN